VQKFNKTTTKIWLGWSHSAKDIAQMGHDKQMMVAEILDCHVLIWAVCQARIELM